VTGEQLEACTALDQDQVQGPLLLLCHQPHAVAHRLWGMLRSFTSNALPLQ
jgi:hypothetical protein